MSRALRCAAAVGMSALLLTGCGSEPAADPGSASTQSSAAADATAEVLLEGMFTDLAAVTELLGGEWTRGGEPFDFAMDRTELNPAPCRSGEVANPQGMDGPLKFQLVLLGPGHPEPDPTLDEVVAWATGQGFEETSRGTGSSPRDGDRFTALRRPDGTLLTVDVSTQRTKVAEYTACSEHPSLQEYKGSDYVSPGNRFKTDDASPATSFSPSE